jgi:hypothetical protein
LRVERDWQGCVGFVTKVQPLGLKLRLLDLKRAWLLELFLLGAWRYRTGFVIIYFASLISFFILLDMVPIAQRHYTA